MRELHPREYGQSSSRDYERAMDGLTDAIAWSRSRDGLLWPEVYARYGGEAARAEGSDEVTVVQTARFFQRSAEVVQARLPHSEACFISGEALDLVSLAAETLPKARLDESDLPIPEGFAWCARPLPLWDEGDSLVALSWSTVTALEVHGRGRVGVLAAHVASAGAVAPRQVLPLPFGEIPGGARDSELLGLAITLWLLMGQRIVATGCEAVGRAVRRRAKAQAVKTVIVVDLRRKQYEKRANGARRVDWTHRWLVRGFWRNQWYPSENRHKPIWIADHVKGPDEKPFVAKRRAFEFKR